MDIYNFYHLIFSDNVYNITPVYADLDKTELVHEFNTSADGHTFIDVTCEGGPNPGVLVPKWFWTVDGYTFDAETNPLPRCFDPTFCDEV